MFRRRIYSRIKITIEALNMAINAIEFMYEDHAEYVEYCKRKESEKTEK